MSDVEHDPADETQPVPVTGASLTLSGPRCGYLMILSSETPGTTGRMYRLDKGESVVGRSSEVDIRLDDDGISRKHAKLVGDVDAYRIVDLGSRNGTFVNGERVEAASLAHGDKIQVGSTTILLFAIQDELEESFQRGLYESATRDPLTGLVNRRTLFDLLVSEFAYGKRHNVPVSVVMLDIDHFKAVNDSHGHLAGDRVLCGVAQALEATVRAEDRLGRYGGEEFAIILRQTSAEAALRCAERCRRRVESSQFHCDGQAVRVTISLGVATLGTDAPNTPEALVALADERLYAAKAAGRNRSVGTPGTSFDPASGADGRERRLHARIEADLGCTVQGERGKSVARIRDLSSSGALLVAPSGLAEPGGLLALEAELVRGAPPVALSARVAWNEKRATDSRYGVMFEDVSAAARASLEDCLRSLLSDHGYGTRQHPRVRWRIELATLPRAHARAVVLDLSTGGMGVISHAPARVGERLEVELDVGDLGMSSFEVQGEVMHVTPLVGGRHRLGLRFVELTAPQRESVHALLRLLVLGDGTADD